MYRQSHGTANTHQAVPPAKTGATTSAQRSRSRPQMGNQAALQLLRDGVIQAKLTVNQPGDRFEQEADRMAAAVMRMPEPQPLEQGGIARSTQPPRIQRVCRECEEGASSQPVAIQRTCANCEAELKHKPALQAKGTPGTTPKVTPAIASRIQSLQGGGQPLPASVRNFFEPRFGYDFSNVRIHSDAQANEATRSVNALAYTMGNDVVFGEGQYRPETDSGKKLLAHELTHVVQQGGGVTRSPGAKPASVQRLGDLSQAPPGMSCPIATTSSADPVVTNVLFPISASSLSAAAIADIDNFVGRWHVAGTNPTVRVDGFASTDGPDPTNWTLSCDRASAVARELEAPSSGVPGIPNQFIEVFAQGETSEFGAVLEPNRRATISANLAIPAPPETITSETVATSPGVRTRTTIGVGEEVNLTHAPGSAAWTTTVGPTPLSATNGDRVIFTAPDTAPATTQRITVTAGAATISFDVIAPTSVAMDREPGTGVKHTLNQPDSGIQTRVFLGPDTVNFSRARYRELDVVGVPTNPGAYSCNTFSTGHCSGAVGGACPDKALTTTVVAGMGTQSLLGDCAYSGHCGTAPPFVPGSITVNIPYEYKVGAGAFHAIRNVPQVHTLAADASTLTSSKAGANGSTTVAAATVTIPQCP